MIIYNYIKRALISSRISDKDLKLMLKYSEIGELIKREMEDNYLFLDPTLDLAKLADKLETNRAYISRAINKVYGKNFNDFVNDYRIEKANSLLSLSRNSNRSIVEIGKMCGFNSYSSFIRQYKSRYNLSPRNYRIKMFSI